MMKDKDMASITMEAVESSSVSNEVHSKPKNNGRLKNLITLEKQIEETPKEDLKSTQLCLKLLDPLKLSKMNALQKDPELCLLKLKLLWHLLVKAQDLMHLEGPQNILESIVSSCVNWIKFDVDIDRTDADLHSVSLQVLNNILSKTPECECISSTTITLEPLSHPVIVSSRIFSRLAGKFISIFHFQEFFNDRHILVQIWHKILEYLEQSWKIISIRVWHDLFSILKTISNNDALQCSFRLTMLHETAKTLTSVLQHSKYIDLDDIMMTPAMYILKTTLCITVNSSGMEISSLEKQKVFMQCSEISSKLCLIMLENAVNFIELKCILNVLESILYPPYLWGLWCGFVDAFCDFESCKILEEFYKEEMIYFRKLRGISMNFDLDLAHLDDSSIIAIEERIEKLQKYLFENDTSLQSNLVDHSLQDKEETAVFPPISRLDNGELFARQDEYSSELNVNAKISEDNNQTLLLESVLPVDLPPVTCINFICNEEVIISPKNKEIVKSIHKISIPLKKRMLTFNEEGICPENTKELKQNFRESNLIYTSQCSQMELGDLDKLSKFESKNNSNEFPLPYSDSSDQSITCNNERNIYSRSLHSSIIQSSAPTTVEETTSNPINTLKNEELVDNCTLILEKCSTNFKPVSFTNDFDVVSNNSLSYQHDIETMQRKIAKTYYITKIYSDYQSSSRTESTSQCSVYVSSSTVIYCPGDCPSIIDSSSENASVDNTASTSSGCTDGESHYQHQPNLHEEELYHQNTKVTEVFNTNEIHNDIIDDNQLISAESKMNESEMCRPPSISCTFNDIIDQNKTYSKNNLTYKANSEEKGNTIGLFTSSDINEISEKHVIIVKDEDELVVNCQQTESPSNSIGHSTGSKEASDYLNRCSPSKLVSIEEEGKNSARKRRKNIDLTVYMKNISPSQARRCRKAVSYGDDFIVLPLCRKSKKDTEATSDCDITPSKKEELHRLYIEDNDVDEVHSKGKRKSKKDENVHISKKRKIHYETLCSSEESQGHNTVQSEKMEMQDEGNKKQNEVEFASTVNVIQSSEIKTEDERTQEENGVKAVSTNVEITRKYLQPKIHDENKICEVMKDAKYINVPAATCEHKVVKKVLAKKKAMFMNGKRLQKQNSPNPKTYNKKRQWLRMVSLNKLRKMKALKNRNIHLRNWTINAATLTRDSSLSKSRKIQKSQIMGKKASKTSSKKNHIKSMSPEIDLLNSNEVVIKNDLKSSNIIGLFTLDNNADPTEIGSQDIKIDFNEQNSLNVLSYQPLDKSFVEENNDSEDVSQSKTTIADKENFTENDLSYVDTKNRFRNTSDTKSDGTFFYEVQTRSKDKPETQLVVSEDYKFQKEVSVDIPDYKKTSVQQKNLTLFDVTFHISSGLNNFNIRSEVSVSDNSPKNFVLESKSSQTENSFNASVQSKKNTEYTLSQLNTLSGNKGTVTIDSKSDTVDNSSSLNADMEANSDEADNPSIIESSTILSTEFVAEHNSTEILNDYEDVKNEITQQVAMKNLFLKPACKIKTEIDNNAESDVSKIFYENKKVDCNMENPLRSSCNFVTRKRRFGILDSMKDSKKDKLILHKFQDLNDGTNDTSDLRNITANDVSAISDSSSLTSVGKQFHSKYENVLNTVSDNIKSDFESETMNSDVCNERIAVSTNTACDESCDIEEYPNEINTVGIPTLCDKTAISTSKFDKVVSTPVKKWKVFNDNSKRLKGNILESAKESPTKIEYNPTVNQFSRASKMLALISNANTTKTDYQEISSKMKFPNKNMHKIKKEANIVPSLSKNSRASRMLALVTVNDNMENKGECPSIEGADKTKQVKELEEGSSNEIINLVHKNETCVLHSEWKKYEPTNREPGPSALKSFKQESVLHKKCVRFDDDKNEIVEYPLEVSPVKTLQDYYSKVKAQKISRPFFRK